MGGRGAQRAMPSSFPPAITAAGRALTPSPHGPLVEEGGRRGGEAERAGRGQVQPFTHTHRALARRLSLLSSLLFLFYCPFLVYLFKELIFLIFKNPNKT